MPAVIMDKYCCIGMYTHVKFISTTQS